MSKTRFIQLILLAATCASAALGFQAPAPPYQAPAVPKPARSKQAIPPAPARLRSRAISIAVPPCPPAPDMTSAPVQPAPVQSLRVAPRAVVVAPTPPAPAALPGAKSIWAAPDQEFATPPQTPKPTQRPAPRPVPAPPAPARREDSGQYEPVVVPLAKGGTVFIRARSGEIRVTGWDSDKVEASASSDEGREKVEATVANERTVTLTSTGAFRRRDVTIRVKVPRYAEVETLDSGQAEIRVSDVDGGVVIRTGNGDVIAERVGAVKVQRTNGDVTLRAVKGEVVAKTLHGDLLVEGAGGSVDLSTANGDLVVRNGGGNVRANSATGDVEIKCAKGRVDAASASGSITIIGAGGSVEASTASGDVSFAGPIRSDGVYRLKTVAGDVQFTLPSDTPGFTATLITYNGGIETAFPIKANSSVVGSGVNKSITGVYGNGGAQLTLDSFSGEVRILKGTAEVSHLCK